MNEPMPDLTHLDRTGAANMVDVSGKASTVRVARAEGRVLMRQADVAGATRRLIAPAAVA